MSIDVDHGITRVWFEGAVTGQTIIDATAEVMAEPAYSDDMDQLWVFLEVTMLDITLEEMQALVAHDMDLVERRGLGPIKVAIVITDMLRYGTIRLYQILMKPSGLDVLIFAQESVAEAWLREG
jgi:hypothetical protein